jgi:hypothetical protein
MVLPVLYAVHWQRSCFTAAAVNAATAAATLLLQNPRA